MLLPPLPLGPSIPHDWAGQGRATDLVGLRAHWSGEALPGLGGDHRLGEGGDTDAATRVVWGLPLTCSLEPFLGRCGFQL